MMKNLIFIYKRDKPVPLIIIGYFLAGFAILGFPESVILSSLLAVASALVLLYHTGIEIDFNNKRYRVFTTLRFFKFGRWMTIPELKYVSVFRVNFLSTNTSRAGRTLTLKNEVLQVNIITKSKMRILLFETLNASKAFELAKEVAAAMSLKIWDASERGGGNWL
jgi:hypothetical protein